MSYHVLDSPKELLKKSRVLLHIFDWVVVDKKFIHWYWWDKVYIHKEECGLRFRDLQDFNTAILAKQFWGLIDKPDYLFSKVFKGRCFRNLDPLDHLRFYSSSYVWWSICSTRSLVKRANKKNGNMAVYFSMKWSLDSCSSSEVSITKNSQLVY